MTTCEFLEAMAKPAFLTLLSDAPSPVQLRAGYLLWRIYNESLNLRPQIFISKSCQTYCRHVCYLVLLKRVKKLKEKVHQQCFQHSSCVIAGKQFPEIMLCGTNLIVSFTCVLLYTTTENMFHHINPPATDGEIPSDIEGSVAEQVVMSTVCNFAFPVCYFRTNWNNGWIKCNCDFCMLLNVQSLEMGRRWEAWKMWVSVTEHPCSHGGQCCLPPRWTQIVCWSSFQVLTILFICNGIMFLLNPLKDSLALNVAV